MNVSIMVYEFKCSNPFFIPFDEMVTTMDYGYMNYEITVFRGSHVHHSLEEFQKNNSS